MPAATAAFSGGINWSGLASAEAIPSEPSDTACSISWTCLFGSLFEPSQTQLTPRSLHAASIPRLTTDQKGPSSECVIMWNVRSEPCEAVTVSDAAADDDAAELAAAVEDSAAVPLVAAVPVLAEL